MRILLIEPSGRRGLDHYVYSLGNALTRRGHQVVLLTALGHETGILPAGYRVIEVFNRFRTNPAKVIGALGTLRHDGIDVTHFHGAIHPEMYGAFMWVVRRMLHCAVVYTAHDIVPWKHRLATGILGPLLTGPLTGMVYRLADVVIVHASENRERVLDRFGVEPDRVHVLPMGNYCFLEDLGKSGELEPGEPGKSVLFFGIVVESKGLMDLLRAFRRVVDLEPSARLVIAGQPFVDVSPYLAEIERLGLADRVEREFRYIPLAEIPEYFRRAAVVVLPYSEASQSAVLQVAYAFGRPVVATAVGGLAEAVEHGKSGILVPPRDEVALADAIVELLADHALRASMGAYARELASSRHSWDRIAAMTEEVYARAD